MKVSGSMPMWNVSDEPNLVIYDPPIQTQTPKHAAPAGPGGVPEKMVTLRNWFYRKKGAHNHGQGKKSLQVRIKG